jgi:hypothetical protein
VLIDAGDVAICLARSIIGPSGLSAREGVFVNNAAIANAAAFIAAAGRPPSPLFSWPAMFLFSMFRNAYNRKSSFVSQSGQSYSHGTNHGCNHRPISITTIATAITVPMAIRDAAIIIRQPWDAVRRLPVLNKSRQPNVLR